MKDISKYTGSTFWFHFRVKVSEGFPHQPPMSNFPCIGWNSQGSQWEIVTKWNMGPFQCGALKHTLAPLDTLVLKMWICNRPYSFLVRIYKYTSPEDTSGPTGGMPILVGTGQPVSGCFLCAACLKCRGNRTPCFTGSLKGERRIVLGVAVSDIPATRGCALPRALEFCRTFNYFRLPGFCFLLFSSPCFLIR